MVQTRNYMKKRNLNKTRKFKKRGNNKKTRNIKRNNRSRKKQIKRGGTNNKSVSKIVGNYHTSIKGLENMLYQRQAQHSQKTQVRVDNRKKNRLDRFIKDLKDDPEDGLLFMKDDQIKKIVGSETHRKQFIEIVNENPKMIEDLQTEIEDDIMLDLVEKNPKLILEWHRLNTSDDYIKNFNLYLKNINEKSNLTKNDNDYIAPFAPIDFFILDDDDNKINPIHILKTALEKAIENKDNNTLQEIVEKAVNQIGKEIFNTEQMKNLKENKIIKSILEKTITIRPENVEFIEEKEDENTITIPSENDEFIEGNDNVILNPISLQKKINTIKNQQKIFQNQKKIEEIREAFFNLEHGNENIDSSNIGRIIQKLDNIKKNIDKSDLNNN